MKLATLRFFLQACDILMIWDYLMEWTKSKGVRAPVLLVILLDDEEEANIPSGGHFVKTAKICLETRTKDGLNSTCTSCSGRCPT